MNRVKDKHAYDYEKPKLGEILLDRHLITEKQLDKALDVQGEKDELIGEILVKLGYVKEIDIVTALVIQCGLPYIAINKYNISKKTLNYIPANIARRYNVIPLDCVGNVLSIVMIDPLDEEIKKELKDLTKCRLATFIATRSEIMEAINRWYND